MNDDTPRDINGDPIVTPEAQQIDPEQVRAGFHREIAQAVMELNGFLRIRKVGDIWLLDMPNGVQAMHPADPKAGAFADWLRSAADKIGADAHAAELELAKLNGRLQAANDAAAAAAGTKQ